MVTYYLAVKEKHNASKRTFMKRYTVQRTANCRTCVFNDLLCFLRYIHKPLWC